MSKLNYTPIKIDKLSKKHSAKLAMLSLLMKSDVQRILADKELFAALHASMDKNCQEFYKDHIPYYGSIIYSPQYRQNVETISTVTIIEDDKWLTG